MLESCTRADLITEITLQPMRRYRVDAAILFSDIVVPLKAIGFGIDIKAGVGPVIDEPIRGQHDLERLRPLEPGDVPYITEAVGALVARARGPAADRLRRRAVHPGLLPDRRRAVPAP